MVGTGKSFLGVLLARALHDRTKETILVVCFTNHALDQFLEELMNNGIPASNITRLGGKSTAQTAQLSVYDAARSIQRPQEDWDEMNSLQARCEIKKQKLQDTLPANFASSGPSTSSILGLLEPRLFRAFQTPQRDDGMSLVGKNGTIIGPNYLFEQWRDGKDAGVFQNDPHVRNYPDVWKLPAATRRARLAEWTKEVVKAEVDGIASIIVRHNELQDRRNAIWSRGNVTVMQEKRIIACTTTAAAKYRIDIRAARPGILLVEEAGEILESHILTAMGSSVKQLILIGDHKQLRPKCNNYDLTVEKGNGYDLNRSLFERLVLRNYPHQTLTLQHRMRTEISSFVRQLTYPELKDAPGTMTRPPIRGLQRNVIFIDHSVSEDGSAKDSDIKGTTKTNTYEIGVVLAIVKYLAQQGYGTDKLVVLTPYLGQLSLLRKHLSSSHDPVLNDLDSFELVKAGLTSPGTAKNSKKPIRLATIGEAFLHSFP